jgi:hypothetical protein
MRTMDYDMCKILTYTPTTGIVKCEKKLKGFHFGAGISTEKEFEVDMRAEVFLLDRNIRIDASLDEIGTVLNEPWGCRVLVSDFREPTGVKRTGTLIMDQV